MLNETLLTMQEASKQLPGRPSIAALYRWHLRGVRGVRLETILIGGRRKTSIEAFGRFVERTSAAATPDRYQDLAQTHRQRRASVAAARRVLANI
jgi:hypothetical protein